VDPSLTGLRQHERQGLDAEERKALSCATRIKTKKTGKSETECHCHLPPAARCLILDMRISFQAIKMLMFETAQK